jgi:hypothetical protein
MTKLEHMNLWWHTQIMSKLQENQCYQAHPWDAAWGLGADGTWLKMIFSVFSKLISHCPIFDFKPIFQSSELDIIIVSHSYCLDFANYFIMSFLIILSCILDLSCETIFFYMKHSLGISFSKDLIVVILLFCFCCLEMSFLDNHYWKFMDVGFQGGILSFGMLKIIFQCFLSSIIVFEKLVVILIVAFLSDNLKFYFNMLRRGFLLICWNSWIFPKLRIGIFQQLWKILGCYLFILFFLILSHFLLELC